MNDSIYYENIINDSIYYENIFFPDRYKQSNNILIINYGNNKIK